MIQIPDSPSGFKIGTAAKMAGISPNTIRTWMRRDYFRPSMETESGERILSSADVKRLISLKTLVDLGDSIGRIAKLDDEALSSRIEELRAASDSAFANKVPSLAELRAAFVSPRNSTRLGSTAHFFWNAKSFQSPADLNERFGDESDISIALYDYQHRDNRDYLEILKFAREHPTIPSVVIFDFMPRAILQELSKARVHLLRWPINSIMMERFLYGILPTIGKAPAAEPWNEDSEPVRLFTERELALLADIQPKLECECPRHLSTIVASMISFEDYTQQCGVNSKEDQELHEYLRRETAKARSIVERALARLCKEDGIQLGTL